MSDAVPKLRSAVTNGKRAFLTKGGELSLVGRRWRDIYGQIVEDRGGDLPRARVFMPALKW